MATLSEAAIERLCELVGAQLGTLPTLERTPFLDNLVKRTMQRYPPRLNLEDDEEIDEIELDALEGGETAAVAFSLDCLEKASRSPYFPLVQQVAVAGDDQAVEQLMAMLDRNLRLRGILFRYRMDPDSEHPAIWGKVWEAIPKWDGRDFRAYVARIVRNHCLDEIARRKRRPGSMEEDPRDVRPRAQSASVAASRDAMVFVMAVLDELEGSGRIKALDGVIFTMISNGRAVADIVQGFRISSVPPRFGQALKLLGGSCEASDAVLLRYLVDGLTPDEAATLTARDVKQVKKLASALGDLETDDEKLLARTLAREGMTVADVDRARRLTTNAINLCINRIRLKVWMALVDRAYESLRRRGSINDAELAIVQHRCTQSPHSGCRMYKDSTCKREADAADIARRGGLDLEADAVREHMAELRRKVIEDGLGLVFPDYNACLIERKPIRRKPAK